MSSNIPYNLDEGSEYFEFIIKGNTYRFRYPSTGEIKEMGEFKTDDEGVKTFLLKFISKVDEKSPNFEDVVDQLNINQLKRFQAMIIKEMGADESNQSPKGT